MINSRLLEDQLLVGRGSVDDPKLIARVYKTFFEMRGILEDYGPSWYSENLHKQVEGIVRDLKKRAPTLNLR